METMVVAQAECDKKDQEIRNTTAKMNKMKDDLLAAQSALKGAEEDAKASVVSAEHWRTKFLQLKGIVRHQQAGGQAAAAQAPPAQPHPEAQ
jgi:hypothetical protein